MLRSTILLVVCSALVAAIPHGAHISQHFTADDEYIVTYKGSTTEAIRTTHLHSVQATGAQVTRRFDFSTFHGFAVRIPAGANPAGRALLASPYVAHVERSQIFRATSDDFEDFPPAVCKVQQNASWGLVRRNKAELEIDGLYSYNALRAGQNTYAFIVDSGIYLDHFDFGNRAVWGYDAVEDPSPHDDPYGHGTFVAGIVGGREWGAAKNVTLVAVRVLNQAGVGSTSGIIAGLEYVATTGAGNRSLALLAISGATSTAINNAVAAVTAVGIPVIVSAGNAGIDACSTSPASESTAIRVAASDSLDRWYPLNNYGSCVDIIAPGVDISSAYIGNAFSQNTLTGTSMAAAAVAGSLANILSGFPPGGLGPSFALSFLLGNAANGTISGVPANTNTTNLLLQDPCF